MSKIFSVLLFLCFTAAAAYAQSITPEHMRGVFKRGCENNKATDCSLYAYYLEIGKGGPVNYPLAIKFNRKACDGRKASACYALGRIIYNGKHVQKDRERGLAYMVQGCFLDRTSKGSCAAVSKPLTWFKMDSTRLTRAFDKVLKIHDLPKKQGYSDKQYVQSIQEKVQELGCDVGDDTACSFYALSELQRSFKGKGSRADAVGYALKGCKTSGTESCTMGARILLEFPKHDKGTDGHIRDVERSGQFIRIACSRNPAPCKFLKNMRKKALN